MTQQQLAGLNERRAILHVAVLKACREDGAKTPILVKIDGKDRPCDDVFGGATVILKDLETNQRWKVSVIREP